MKRRYTTLILTACLLLTLLFPAITLADDPQVYVMDEAKLLSPAEADLLENMAAETAEAYGCGLYIVTLEDYRQYGNTPLEAAENCYLERGLGCGTEKNGVILMLSMAERDYALYIHGEIAETAFTQYGMDEITDEFLQEFADDWWVDGFRAYLQTGEKYLSLAADGVPFDADTDPSARFGKVLMVVLIPCVVAGIVCLIFVSQMKTAHKQTQATAYMAVEASELTLCQDIFTHRTESRRKIQSSSSSGSGSKSSSGRSGKF